MKLPQVLSRRLSRNVLLLVTDSAVTNVASFAILIIITRCYGDQGAEVVGRMSLLLAIMAVGVLLGDLGAGQASTLWISQRRAGLIEAPLGRTVASGLLHAVVGGLLAGTAVVLLIGAIETAAGKLGLAAKAREIGDLRHLMPLVAVWVFVAVIMQQASGIFAGFQKMQYTLVQNASTHVPRLVICLGAAMVAWPWQRIVWGWTAWYLVVLGLTVALIVLVVRRSGEHLSLIGYRPLPRLRAGAVLFTPLAASFILQYLALAILWAMASEGQGYDSVGYFAPLWSLTRGYEVLLWPLAVALLPAVSDARGANTPEVFEGLVRRALMATGLVAAAVLLLFMVAPQILLAIFGAQYAGFVLPLMVLAFGVAFEAQRCALDPILNGSGLARWVTVIEWAKFALLFVLAVLLYPSHYLTGVALAFLGAFLPAWVAKVALIRFRLKVHVLWSAAMMALLLAAVFAAGLVLRYVRW